MIVTNQHARSTTLTQQIDVLCVSSFHRARLVFRQLLSGLSAIHAAGLVHRDLSLMNLLLDKDFNLVSATPSQLTLLFPLLVQLQGTRTVSASHVIEKPNHSTRRLISRHAYRVVAFLSAENR